MLPRAATSLALLVALALLAESFGREVCWLWRLHRATTNPVLTGAPRRVPAGAGAPRAARTDG